MMKRSAYACAAHATSHRPRLTGRGGVGTAPAMGPVAGLHRAVSLHPLDKRRAIQLLPPILAAAGAEGQRQLVCRTAGSDLWQLIPRPAVKQPPPGLRRATAPLF